MARTTRKAPRRPKSAGTPRPRPATKAFPPDGPLTLEEAKAIALASRPKLAAKTAAKTATQPTSPAAVGAERKELKKKQQNEIARRTKEYTAVMRLMKKRGAAAPTERKGGRRTWAKPTGFKPLQVLAEGDSWFDYPVPLFGGGIIPRLQARLGVPILNLAAAGDETRFMMGVEQSKKLVKHLKNGCPAGGPWDMLLFSGGGNDIVGDPMALWVSQWVQGKPPLDHMVQKRFDAALSLVRAAYENLIGLRDTLSPSTHIVFHAYDYAIPDGRGICHIGPWLKPAFDLRNFPSQAAAQPIVRAMIDGFADMLAKLAKAKDVTFIRTPGTLAPVPASWHNELHPSKDGFNLFARLFHEKIKVLFPDRVV